MACVATAGLREERLAVVDRILSRHSTTLADCAEVMELVRLVDDSFRQEELLRGRADVGGFGLPGSTQHKVRTPVRLCCCCSGTDTLLIILCGV